MPESFWHDTPASIEDLCNVPEAGAPPLTLTETTALTAPQLLPDFEVRVAALFRSPFDQPLRAGSPAGETLGVQRYSFHPRKCNLASFQKSKNGKDLRSGRNCHPVRCCNHGLFLYRARSKHQHQDLIAADDS